MVHTSPCILDDYSTFLTREGQGSSGGLSVACHVDRRLDLPISNKMIINTSFFSCSFPFPFWCLVGLVVGNLSHREGFSLTTGPSRIAACDFASQAYQLCCLQRRRCKARDCPSRDAAGAWQAELQGTGIEENQMPMAVHAPGAQAHESPG